MACVIDHIKCKYKDWKADLKLAQDDANISILMSPSSPSSFTDIKKYNVLHHLVQAKKYISILK